MGTDPAADVAGSDHVALLVPEALLLGYLGEELGSKIAASDTHHLRCGVALGDELVRMIHRFGESPSKTLARSAHPPCKRLTEILLRP